MSIITTKGSGLKITEKYIKKVIYQWGCLDAGSIKRSIITINKNITLSQCIKFINLTNSSIEKQIPGFLDLLNFQIKRVLALTGGIKLDYEYWNEKDWLNKSYYYKCKLNLLKKLVPKIFGDIFLFFLKTKKGQSS